MCVPPHHADIITQTQINTQPINLRDVQQTQTDVNASIATTYGVIYMSRIYSSFMLWLLHAH